MEPHRQTPKVRMLRALRTGSDRDKEHRIEPHRSLSFGKLVHILIVTFAQRGETHKAAGNVIRFLMIQGSQHALS
jgi:hypothetical protein